MTCDTDPEKNGSLTVLSPDKAFSEVRIGQDRAECGRIRVTWSNDKKKKPLQVTGLRENTHTLELTTTYHYCKTGLTT